MVWAHNHQTNLLWETFYPIRVLATIALKGQGFILFWNWIFYFESNNLCALYKGVNLLNRWTSERLFSGCELPLCPLQDEIFLHGWKDGLIKMSMCKTIAHPYLCFDYMASKWAEIEEATHINKRQKKRSSEYGKENRARFPRKRDWNRYLFRKEMMKRKVLPTKYLQEATGCACHPGVHSSGA